MLLKMQNIFSRENSSKAAMQIETAAETAEVTAAATAN